MVFIFATDSTGTGRSHYSPTKWYRARARKDTQCCQLTNGGIINGIQVDPVILLIHGLHDRFGALDEETRMTAMREMLSFRR